VACITDFGGLNVLRIVEVFGDDVSFSPLNDVPGPGKKIG
jgi:hypothetical protein